MPYNTFMPRFADPERQRLFIERLSAGRKGKCVGDANPSKRKDVREKISTKLKGRNADWLYGDKNPAKQLAARGKIRNNKKSQATRFQKGHTPANKNQTKETSETVRKNAEVRTGRKNTEEQIQNIKNGLPPNHRETARENALNNIITGKWQKPSKHEDELEKILIEELLMLKNKDYLHPHRIGNFAFDFFIVQNNGIIETDGREHKHDKEIKVRDKLKEEFLKQHNYPIIRFEDKEIYNNKHEVIEKIKCFIHG